jgi:uncharacterized membrane protein YbaN (DUF454 family)
MRRGLLSIIGALMSIFGIIGVVFSSVISEIFISVIAAISGLFALAVRNHMT